MPCIGFRYHGGGQAPARYLGPSAFDAALAKPALSPCQSRHLALQACYSPADTFPEAVIPPAGTLR